MKCKILLVLLLTCVFAFSQSQSLQPDDVLKKTLRALQSIQSMAYDHVRELNYSSENYHNVSKWSVYYNFASSDTVAGFTYQTEDADHECSKPWFG